MTEEQRNGNPDVQVETSKRARIVQFVQTVIGLLREAFDVALHGKSAKRYVRDGHGILKSDIMYITACKLSAAALVTLIGCLLIKASYLPLHAIGGVMAADVGAMLVIVLTLLVVGTLLFGKKVSSDIGELVARSGEKVLKGILLVAIVVLLVGFGSRHAEDKHAVQAFYQLKWDNVVGRWLANHAYKPETDTYGPVKIARCQGGTAVSWWGKWVLVTPAEDPDQAALVRNLKRIEQEHETAQGS